MIIDIHTHTFPVKIAGKALHLLQGNCHTALFSDGTESGLAQAEEKAGIDLAVIQPVATYPEQVISINNHVIQGLSEKAQNKLLSFAAMHPAFSGWEAELERIAENGIPGIKIHPPYTQVNMDDPRTIRLLKKCRELQLIVLIHSGWDVGVPDHDEAHPERIRRAMDAAGCTRIIAAHMAGWKCWDAASRLLPDTGIYLDTSFSLGKLTPAPDRHVWNQQDLQLLTDSEFCDMVHLFGPERILFGTDSPWADPASELEKIRSLPLPEKDLNAICGLNAQQLLGLSQRNER